MKKPILDMEQRWHIRKKPYSRIANILRFHLAKLHFLRELERATKILRLIIWLIKIFNKKP